MIVKKFTAATETDAVLKAKSDLGPNAVVLNVKSIKQRGIAKLFKRDYIEITAALEEKENVQAPNPNANKALRQSQSAFKFQETEKSIALEEKIDNLHSLLQSQMEKSLEEEKKENTKTFDNKDNYFASLMSQNNNECDSSNSNVKYLKLIYNKLLDSEVDEKLANNIIEDIDSSLKKESNIDSIISAVYQKIILKLGEPSLINLNDKQSIIFFIGPTGVGKTTTIAKVASDFKFNKNKKIAMITADTYRIAAVEQLNTYAAILDVPVTVIFSASELVDAVKEYSEYDMILVDTAGRSHKNSEQLDELFEMFKAIEGSDLDANIEKYLVLSATTKYRDLKNITEAYKDISDYKLIFTKLDETSAYGNILNVRVNTNAPLSYVTCGQNVPDDIVVADVQSLAKHLISGAER